MWFLDYYWSNGVPKGLKPLDTPAECCFKIFSDPYRKRYIIEKYNKTLFQGIVYDSYLFDFRSLKKKEEQEGWMREKVTESLETQRNIIRALDERVLLVEDAQFQESRCASCRWLSPHGIWLATQIMCRVDQGRPFDGAALYDTENHPVVIKKYQIDPATGEFTYLIEEVWEHYPSGTMP
jgi:hypothetical protein